MIIDSEQTNQLFSFLTSDLSEPNGSTSKALETFRPLDPSLMDWRYELFGFVRGLRLGGLISPQAVTRTRNTLFGPVKAGEKREGRDYHYSVDVHSRGVNNQTRIIQFDVAAMNTFDAYVQLTKRLVYRTIPDVYSVKVYTEFVEARKDNQSAARIFEADELIFVGTK